MNKKVNRYRWTLLKHIGAPGDLAGFHFDFLLEDSTDCKTWRLKEIPQLDGPSVQAISLPPHRLQWLEIEKSVLSGGRGFAYRVSSGYFWGNLSTKNESSIKLDISWYGRFASLEINKNTCRIITK